MMPTNDQLRSSLYKRKLTIDEIDGWLRVVDAERAELLAIQAEVEASAPTKVMLNQHEQSILADVRADLFLVSHGVPFGASMTNPRLALRVGKPGLLELSDIEERLKARRDERAAYEQLWSGQKSLPHRYIGRQKKMLWDGVRYLEPGDVVELNERQASAFRDKFELVSPVPPDHLVEQASGEHETGTTMSSGIPAGPSATTAT